MTWTDSDRSRLRAGLFFVVALTSAVTGSRGELSSPTSTASGQETPIFKLDRARPATLVMKPSPDGARWLVTWRRTEPLGFVYTYGVMVPGTPTVTNSLRFGGFERALLGLAPGLSPSARSLCLNPADTTWWLQGDRLTPAWRSEFTEWLNNRYLRGAIHQGRRLYRAVFDIARRKALVGSAAEVVLNSEVSWPIPMEMDYEHVVIPIEDDVETVVEGMGYQVGSDFTRFWEDRSPRGLSLFKIVKPTPALVAVAQSEPIQVVPIVSGEVEPSAMSRDLGRLFFFRGNTLYRADFTEPLPELLQHARKPSGIPDPPDP